MDQTSQHSPNPALTYRKQQARSQIVDSRFTHDVQCDKFFERFMNEHGQRKAKMFVSACQALPNNQFKRLSEKYEVSNIPVPLSRFCPKGHDNYVVEIEFIDVALDPNKLMTRGEWVMEQRIIYEQMRDRAAHSNLSPTLVTELDLVIKYNSEVYAFHELTDTSTL